MHPKGSKNTNESAKLVMADAEAKSLAGSRTRLRSLYKANVRKK